ncbi:MAG: DUF418 domain-containing protein [Erythrobacter sp.]|nr:DUF418 domain-containing protein [Erythrobacter sp.]
MAVLRDPANRIVALDALRGFAVIGIVWMNVYVFALPGQGYLNPTAWGPGIHEESAADRVVWAIGFIFVEDKFRTLFAMLFGAGCLILIERSGGRRWRSHYARMAILFVLGLAHALLLASNDVLRAYAFAGLAIPFLAHLSARSLYTIAIGLVLLHVGAGTVMFGGAVVDAYAGRTGSDAALFVERQFGRDPAAIAYMLEQGREGLDERIARRIGSVRSQLTVVAASIPLNLAAMALGMGLWKHRALAGEWRLERPRHLAAVTALFALPPLFALAWWITDRDFPAAFVAAGALVLSAPFDTALGLCYAALAMALFAQGGALTKRLAAVGRLSLTNYLMTSVILGAIFANWGLGLFGEVGRAGALALSFLPIAAMLWWSPVWIARFGQGPVERLWRASAQALS